MTEHRKGIILITHKLFYIVAVELFTIVACVKFNVSRTGNCSAGHMIQGKTCKVCPLGTYQDKKWQTECKGCGNKMTTSKEGATTKDHCFCKWFLFVRPYVYFDTTPGS